MLSVKQQYFLAFVLILVALIVGTGETNLVSKVNNMNQFQIGSENYYSKNGTLFKSELYFKFKDLITLFLIEARFKQYANFVVPQFRARKCYVMIPFVSLIPCCSSHIYAMQPIIILLFAARSNSLISNHYCYYKGHTPHKRLNFPKRFTNLLSGLMPLILN